MRSLNIRKISALAVIFSLIGMIAISFQNFTPGEIKKEDVQAPKEQTKKETTLMDAMSAALANAEQDHKASQVALNVEPSKIEKSTFKRDQELKVIEVGSEAHLRDTAEDAPIPLGDESDNTHQKMEKVEDSPL